MTLTELRYIVALARERHFGRAAKACHVSQPTLSVAIQKLESSLGTNIFERFHQDIRLTEIGEKIVNQAKRALEEIQGIHQIADGDKSQLHSTVKIGGIFTVAPYLFPLFIPKLQKIAPHMPLFIQEDFTANLRQKLQQGELDAIFVALPFSAPGIVTRTLYEENFVVLMKKDHALAAKKTISPKDLVGEPVLLLGEGHCMRDQVLETCPHCYNPHGPQQIIEGTSLETLRHMVASGMGLTILPESATQVKHYKSLLCVKPFQGSSPKRSIVLAWRVSYPRPKAIDAIIQSVERSHTSG